MRRGAAVVALVLASCAQPPTPGPVVAAADLPTTTMHLVDVEPRRAPARPSRSRVVDVSPPVTPGAPQSRAAILACIRSYEGWYTANTGNGYYGAYQFLRSTWDSVASRHAPRLVGVRPDRAAPRDQDYLAWKLYQERGLAPWGTNVRANC